MMIVVRRARRYGGRLFQYDVRVRSADAERTHAGTARPPIAFPRNRAGIDDEWAGVELELGIWRVEIHQRRDFAMLKCKHRLNQTGDPRRGVQVTEVGL
jgi:hypothetical protein